MRGSIRSRTRRHARCAATASEPVAMGLTRQILRSVSRPDHHVRVSRFRVFVASAYDAESHRALKLVRHHQVEMMVAAIDGAARLGFHPVILERRLDLGGD